MRNGVISGDALGSVNVERSNPSLEWNFEQMSRIGRVEASDYKNKVESQVVGIFSQLVYGILPLLLMMYVENKS